MDLSAIIAAQHHRKHQLQFDLEEVERAAIRAEARQLKAKRVARRMVTGCAAFLWVAIRPGTWRRIWW